MDALRCLSNPENKIAEAALMENYKLQMTNDEQSGFIIATPLPETFTSRRETLRLMPLYELLEELFSIFGMSRIEKQDAYLFSFFDAVTEYLQSNSSELASFIRYWDETLCSKTIPSGEMNGIRILSIHKSKGLEFHTVLIPFCDWKLENETNNQLVWCAPPEEPYNAISLVPVNYSTTMAESIYRQDYLHERLQLWVDNLNLLYVAFTRAGKNLILWSRKEQKGTMSELLANTLPHIAKDGAGSWDEEASIYENGKICPSPSPSHSMTQTTLLTTKLNLYTTNRNLYTANVNLRFTNSNQSTDFRKSRSNCPSTWRACSTTSSSGNPTVRQTS